ncbi:hypothetical protein BKA00_006846 [Actinomadura coerulea]|uniref:Uncharacterized protein n=1 Tax=Actinomadura coerulea TaxID=46159 RepID=A0A7X0L2W0_9ACTN|nr:hypothetical protein [Actinomadura coerulea]MBB6399932.1 hypothetical protein [Actinomadura coerulea]
MAHDHAQTDHETEQFAHDLEGADRSLKRAVGQPGALAGPATVYGVLDAVHTALSGLDQLFLQLERFLVRQHLDRQLVHDHGVSLDETLETFSRAVLHARHLGTGCSEAVDQARSTINHVHGRGLPPMVRATPSPDPVAEPVHTAALRRADPQATRPDNGRLRTRWFGNSRREAGA